MSVVNIDQRMTGPGIADGLSMLQRTAEALEQRFLKKTFRE
jgi:hypothetical protein